MHNQALADSAFARAASARVEARPHRVRPGTRVEVLPGPGQFAHVESPIAVVNATETSSTSVVPVAGAGEKRKFRGRGARFECVWSRNQSVIC
jgi:hypothetical protein